MRKKKYVVGMECKGLLETAMQKSLPLTITHKNGDLWQVHKSQIVDIQRHRMVITEPQAQAGQTPVQWSPGSEVAVTFKKGYNKCVFVSRVITEEQYEVEPGVKTACMLIYCPEQIEKVQRRSFERTEVPSTENVVVTFWPSNDASAKHYGKLVNLSAGGIGVTMPEQDVPNFHADQQCDIQFVAMPGQEPIVAQGRFRHVARDSGVGLPIVGFQFIGLELSDQGRSTMRRIGRIVTIYSRRQNVSGSYQR
ncbi:MAG: PilZ domain-containing protein [Phycisphaerae bacterium]|nr:PilZ domain-containing protein [Phycisphaerae bacterium]